MIWVGTLIYKKKDGFSRRNKQYTKYVSFRVFILESRIVMEAGMIKNMLMRLVVIKREVSKLRIECLKKNYENVGELLEHVQVLQNEESMIIDQLDCKELVNYYEDYKDTLTKSELEVFSRVLMELHVKKINEERGR